MLPRNGWLKLETWLDPSSRAHTLVGDSKYLPEEAHNSDPSRMLADRLSFTNVSFGIKISGRGNTSLNRGKVYSVQDCGIIQIYHFWLGIMATVNRSRLADSLLGANFGRLPILITLKFEHISGICPLTFSQAPATLVHATAISCLYHCRSLLQVSRLQHLLPYNLFLTQQPE